MTLARSPGPGPARPALARLAAAAATLLILLAGTAAPQPATAHPPAPPPPASAAVAATAAGQPDGEGGGFGEAPVTDRYGISVFDYEIAARQGGGPDGLFTRLEIWLSNVLFALCRLIVVALIWLLAFALDFGLGELLLGPVRQLVGVYQTNIVGGVDGGGWGLVPLALMICVFWFGLAALRGRVGKGAGEIILSFGLSAVLGAVLANPGLLLGEEGLVGRAKDIGVEIAVTAVQPPDADPPPCVQQLPARGQPLVDGCRLDQQSGAGPPARAEPQFLRWIMQMWLVDMYIRRPHQQMTYGQRLDCPLVLTIRADPAAGDPDPCRVPYEQGGDHPCVGQYNQILTTSPATAPAPPGADPGSYMYDMMHPDEPVPGCPEGATLAGYLDQSSGDRLAVGFLLLVALLLLATFLLVGVLIPILVAQVMIAVLAVALVFVLPVALLGGGARRVLWRWFGLLLAAVFLLIIALAGLAAMLITTELLLQSHQRFFFLNLLIVAVSSVLFLMVQRRLLAGSLVGGRRIGAAIEDMPIGRQQPGTARLTVRTTAGWVRPPIGAVAATAGYRPYDRYRANQAVRREVYQQQKYTHQWTRRQQRRDAGRRRASKFWRGPRQPGEIG